MSWTFDEGVIESHYGVLSLFRDRCEREGYSVTVHSQLDSGKGSMIIDKKGDRSFITYELPESVDRLYKVISNLMKQ